LFQFAGEFGFLTDVAVYEMKRVVELISLFMPLILCVTVVASVGIGVVAAYAAVIGILEACGRASRPQAVEAAPRMVLVPSQNHAGGD
jgi:hypothetical protein